MFERFTDRGRRVLVLAQEESRLLGHAFIGTGHILLGLIHEGEGVAAMALSQLGIQLEAVRRKVGERGERTGPGASPGLSGSFTPRAKKVLELALRESLQLNHNYIGTEHLLLGMARQGEGVGFEILAELGSDEIRVRQTVLGLLSDATAIRGRPPVALERRAVQASSGVAGHLGPGPGGLTAVCSFCGRDLWEVGRHVVAEFAAMCEECVTTAVSTLEAGEVDQTGAVDFPPRLFGHAPDDDAVRQVVASFRSTFGPPAQEPAPCEDAEELAPFLLRLSRDRSRHLLVTRVRFLDDDRAEVTIQSCVGAGRAAFGFGRPR